MKKKYIFEQIKPIIQERLFVENVNRKSNFIHDLGADSLDKVELNLFIEDKYNIRISDSEAISIILVEDLLNLIKYKI